MIQAETQKNVIKNSFLITVPEKDVIDEEVKVDGCI